MHRRHFVQTLSLLVATATAPLAFAGAVSEAPGDGTEKKQEARAFRKALVVQCTIIDMISGKQRIVAIESSAPLMIDEGKGPFAVSIGEHGDDLLSMTIYSRKGDDLIKGQTTYIGMNSMQVLRNRGVVLQFVTHES